MSTKKQFLKSKPECKVNFRVEKLDVNEQVKSIKILGSFNDWQSQGEDMNPLKDGSFTKTISFSTGQEIQFRYLVNDKIWLTDQETDGLVETGLGDNQYNSVIRV